MLRPMPSVMSYDGHLDFGVVADRDQMPDLWCLMDWLEDELNDLLDAARG
jgi:diacylglycerol O-acyltransferase / wax synthase